ncbi:MAG: Clostripain [Acidobacteria bacterium]|nr:Clostripain [Acidobacteriota bacterium]
MRKKEWTIMIYMAGDNNLSVDMAYAMEQIKGVAVEGADSPNLFVYYDGNSPSIPTLYCDFSDPHKPKYVRSFKVQDKLFPVPAKENENAADKKSVVNFVDWCVNNVEVETDGEISYGRRAKRYALIFSGHSLGFEDKGLFKDETSGKTMKLSDLSLVLQRLTATGDTLEDLDEPDSKENCQILFNESKVILGKRLDILGFDSCVMGMLEVGYQFCDYTKTMIVSEGSVPSAGWTYAKLLGRLAHGNTTNGSAKKVAEHFVRDFIDSQDKYTVGGVSVDMAAWDTSRLDEVADAFDYLGGTLIECFRYKDSSIYRAMERVILQVHWKCQSYMYDQNVDLGDFCELLERECGLVAQELGGDTEVLSWAQEACKKVLSELRRAVILSGFSGGEYQYSNGISVFFPWSLEGYNGSRKEYESLWLAKDQKMLDKKFRTKTLTWSDFLKKYLTEVTRRRSEDLTPHALPGSKYRYKSGIEFDEQSDSGSLGGSRATMTKLAGQEGSKLAGQEGSKLAGQEGSKLAGQEGSKLAGQEGSKLAGQEGSKLAGQEGSKMGGGSSSAFFNNLKLWKNIESPYNISGFTKRPEKHEPEADN